MSVLISPTSTIWDTAGSQSPMPLISRAITSVLRGVAASGAAGGRTARAQARRRERRSMGVSKGSGRVDRVEGPDRALDLPPRVALEVGAGDPPAVHVIHLPRDRREIGPVALHGLAYHHRLLGRLDPEDAELLEIV